MYRVELVKFKSESRHRMKCIRTFRPSVRLENGIRHEEAELVSGNKGFGTEDNESAPVTGDCVQVFFVAIGVHPQRPRTRNIRQRGAQTGKPYPCCIIINKYAKKAVPELVVTADMDGRHLRVNQCEEKLVRGLLCTTAIEHSLVRLHQSKNRSVIIRGTSQNASAPVVQSSKGRIWLQMVHRPVTAAPERRPDLRERVQKSANAKNEQATMDPGSRSAGENDSDTCMRWKVIITLWSTKTRVQSGRMNAAWMDIFRSLPGFVLIGPSIYSLGIANAWLLTPRETVPADTILLYHAVGIQKQ